MNVAARSMDAEVLRGRLRTDGHATLRMQGQSMFPLLAHGTRAHLRPVADDERLGGAIVAIEIGQQVVVHKVVATHGGTVLTQGIASSKRDASSSRQAIIGVVSARVGWPLSEGSLRRSASALMLARRGLRALVRRP